MTSQSVSQNPLPLPVPPSYAIDRYPLSPYDVEIVNQRRRQPFRRPHTIILLAPFVLVLALSGCGPQQTTTAELWTDRASVAAYAEMYNASQDRFKVEVELVEEPADALLERRRHPDIIVGDFLANETAFEHFTSLDDLLSDDDLSEDEFYTGLFDLGRQDGETRLLPVSFDLPLAMFKRSQLNEDLDQLRLPMQRLREEGAAFNETNDDRYVRMGFSPRWNSEFLYLAAMSFGANFREQGPRNPVWNQEPLEQAVEYAGTWIEESNGGREAEDDFEEKYLYDPPYQLLLRDRIRFSYSTATQFYDMPEGSRNNVDFRWISRQGSIPVLEDITYIGIPREAQRSKAGRDFIRWFFDQETQTELIEALATKRIGDFGIAGGFSSLVATNEEKLPRAYERLLGRIPPPSLLEFPHQVPKNWDAVKEAVVYPWLDRATDGGATAEELQRQLQEWLLQRGD